MCGCVSFLVVAGNSSQNENMFLQKNLIGLLCYDPLGDVCISQDLTLFYSVSFFFVYFSCAMQICKLKFKPEYYLRINIRNRVKMQTPAIPLWFPEQCLLGFFILEKQLASQDMFLVRSELSITAYLFLLLYRSHPYNHYRFSKILRPFCASRYWWIIVVFLQCNSLTTTIVSQKYRDLLQSYSHYRFSKISRTFYASRKSWIIVVFLQCTLKDKLPIFL